MGSKRADFIACDWGTSNMRLYLCACGDSGEVTVLDSRKGRGVSQVESGFESALFALTEDWHGAHGSVPVLASGMVGSTRGWTEAPYAQCPADAETVARNRVEFQARGQAVLIVGGLRCSNPLDAPDVMRGEELQLLGWIATFGHELGEPRLIALPGTHNKWALVTAGRVETFLTALTGELFAVLKAHSILLESSSEQEFSEEAFRRGLSATMAPGASPLIHALFSARSRQLLGELSPSAAPSYLSGLLVGADVAGALSVFSEHGPDADSVEVIAEPALADRYRTALEARGRPCTVRNATEISLAGYGAVYNQWRAAST